MKLHYIVYEDFSQERASNWQIANTTRLLGDLGLKVVLLFPYKFSLGSHYKINSQVVFLFDRVFSKFDKLNIFKFSLKLFSHFKQQKNQADNILYFRHVVLLPAVLFIKTFLPKIKIVYEAHREVNDSFGRWCEEQLISREAKLIVISEALKKIYLNNYKKLLDKNIQVVHDAVDFEKFAISVNSTHAKQKLGINLERPVVMYIGSLWLVKGVDLLLKVAKILPNLDFYLVGKEYDDFIKFKEDYKNLPNIFIHGAVPHGEVPLWQMAADLLVVPHPQNNLSQSPLKLFEYLASGRPIVAARLDNLTEVLPTGSLLFVPGEATDLANKIRQFFKERDIYEEQAKNNQNIARQYSWENRARLIKDFISN